jgi:hypothetical protein
MVQDCLHVVEKKKYSKTSTVKETQFGSFILSWPLTLLSHQETSLYIYKALFTAQSKYYDMELYTCTDSYVRMKFMRGNDAVCFCWFLGWITLKTEAIGSSETLNFLRTTQPYNPRDRNFTHGRESLRSKIITE